MEHTYTGKTGQNEIVPEGDYVLCVVEAEEGFKDGDPQMKVKCEIEGSNGVAWERLTSSEKAGWRVDQFVTAWATFNKKAPPPKGESIRIEAHTILGQRVPARIATREYNGKQQNEIVHWIVDPKYLVPENGAPALVSEPAAAAPSPFPAASQAAASDDDLPF